MGTVFTNDAAVLIFTPLVFHLVERVAAPDWGIKKKLPFYFAVLYVANLVGGLVISNPINIVVSSLFRIGFVEYARWMLLPAAVSILVSYAGLKVFFGRSIPLRFELPADMRSPSRPGRLQLWCAAVLIVTLIGFFSEGWSGIPTWLVAVAGAATLLAVYSAIARSGLEPIFRRVGWDVVLFLCGMFVVGMGLRSAGFTHMLGRGHRGTVGRRSGSDAPGDGTARRCVVGRHEQPPDRRDDGLGDPGLLLAAARRRSSWPSPR